MGDLILILGGARSGKSTYAEKLAGELAAARGSECVLYVATARADDEEMRERIEKHQSARPATWRTLEAQKDIGRAIQEAAANTGAVLVDCWTVMVANLLLGAAGPENDPFDEPSADPFDPAIEARILAEGEALIGCAAAIEAPVIVVANEVGMGVVPPYELGRAYRDALGRANQQLAARAAEVTILFAGLPLRLK